METHRLFPTLCLGTAPTTEHVYVSNHARGLVDYSLRCARRLCRQPSMFMFPTTLGDLSTNPYVVLGDCADHQARYARGLVNQSIYKIGDCTDHRARYARGLVDESVYETGDCTDHRAWYALGLVDHSIYETADCADHRACLHSQPRSEICQLVPTLYSKIVPITEHVYIPNHARTSSITSYTILEVCFDYSPTTV